jgi:putative hydrolase of the HAD superfamily
VTPASATVRAIVLDYGGVIMDMRWDLMRKLEDAHELPENTLVDTLYSSDEWRDLAVGKGDRGGWRAAAHRALEAAAGRPLPQLHEEWRSGQRLIDENVALARRLRARYAVSVLSNADITLRDRLRGWKLDDLFDDVVCSAEVGVAKPDPRIYALAAGRLRLEARACLFVDDSERNIAAARAAGMQAVHFRIDRGDSLEDQLASLGVRAMPGG